MESPTKTEPPFVPLRRTGWASRRTPMRVFAVIIVLAAGVVLVSLSHKPSQAQRVGDLTAVGILTYNAQNCSPANNQPLQDFTGYQVTSAPLPYLPV